MAKPVPTAYESGTASRSHGLHWLPEPLKDYTFKQAADNIKALADQLGAKKIILGGHDW
jgi:pimeloyl-ACP methyl ester carboxylesterase